ncbi:hypothetical protein G9C85_00745 [Halorubellus sp. JP-L1]|uniref:DUF7261 family protein n=1 Tax=Halorubellus sp. JP-L1 TaxID=2715753 RepID=UPI00140ABC27|nr:hypothetical protein [Halorubellus sp. JP-L1]NHN40163.1 hypothetical protein [Halorubellus sp. JP-L1]
MVGSAFDEHSERAQLILVGAVAIAFIVLGLAVVFNTVLYTENVASSGAVNEPREAQQMNREARLGTQRLVDRIGTGNNWTNDDALEDAIEGNVSAYSSGLANVTGNSRPTMVSLQVDEVTQMGAYVQHRDGSAFDDESAIDADRNWTLATNDARTRAFETTFRVDSLDGPRGVGGDPFRIVWDSSESSGTYTVWIYRTGTGPDDDVVVQPVANRSNPKVAWDASEACVLPGSADNDTVTIDFENGVIDGYPSCSDELDVNTAVQRSEERSIDFFNGTKAAGQYGLVVDDDGNVGSDVFDPTTLGGGLLTGDETPYYTHVAWSVEFEMTYGSGSVTFTESYEIEVYNRSR